MLLLDAWLRSKLPATEFAALVGVASTTLYGWRKRVEELGPAALLRHKRGQRGSGLAEPTERAILMMKQPQSDTTDRSGRFCRIRMQSACAKSG